MTYYRVSRYSNKIQEVEFTRVTEHFGFRRQGIAQTERREALMSSWDRYYPTRKEAVAALRTRLEQSIENAQDALKKAQDDYQNFAFEEAQRAGE